LGFKDSIVAVISAADCPFSAIIAASMTRSPIPVERFAESTTVTRSDASNSSAARRMTFPEVDMLPEMEKQTISRFSSIYGRKRSMASARDGADVLGVVLCASDQS